MYIWPPIPQQGPCFFGFSRPECTTDHTICKKNKEQFVSMVRTLQRIRLDVPVAVSVVVRVGEI
jgi:hypothetical protein